jgi:16S rRNA (guanine527-N7)-methyltransferase
MSRTDRPRGSIAAQVEALAARHSLPTRAVERLEALLCLLAEDPFAPTTIHDPWRVVDDHLADSLVVLEVLQVRRASRIVDLGSGAGLPGLPLAIALPEASFVLLDSSARRCAFLERAVATLGLGNVEVVHSRAESYDTGLRSFQLATVRALASLDVVVEYAAPLLRVGGRLIAWRGRLDRDDDLAAQRAAQVLGMNLEETVPVKPYPAASNRHLTLMSKVSETPPRFPRRPGKASKHPLGASDRPRR